MDKKISVIILVVILILSLTSCKSAQQDTTSSELESSAQSEQSEKPEKTKPKQPQQKLESSKNEQPSSKVEESKIEPEVSTEQKKDVENSHPDKNPEDALMQVEGEFYWKNRKYHRYFGETTAYDNLGEKLGVVRSSVDKNLQSMDIYEYLPANSQALVAIKVKDSYELYQFANFVSYENNQDEDMIAYFDVYGIKSAADIDRIEMFSYPDALSIDNLAMIIDTDEISNFYNIVSKFTNNSNEYFSALNNYSVPQSSSSDEGEPFDPGGGALDNNIRIDIVTESGLRREFFYFPNIEFLSRYKVSPEFIQFIEKYK